MESERIKKSRAVSTRPRSKRIPQLPSSTSYSTSSSGYSSSQKSGGSSSFHSNPHPHEFRPLTSEEEFIYAVPTPPGSARSTNRPKSFRQSPEDSLSNEVILRGVDLLFEELKSNKTSSKKSPSRSDRSHASSSKKSFASSHSSTVKTKNISRKNVMVDEFGFPCPGPVNKHQDLLDDLDISLQSLREELNLARQIDVNYNKPKNNVKDKEETNNMTPVHMSPKGVNHLQETEHHSNRKLKSFVESNSNPNSPARTIATTSTCSSSSYCLQPLPSSHVINSMLQQEPQSESQSTSAPDSEPKPQYQETPFSQSKNLNSLYPRRGPPPLKRTVGCALPPVHIQKSEAFRHAQSAGLLWASIVGNFVRFPVDWFQGKRTPPMCCQNAKWHYVNLLRLQDPILSEYIPTARDSGKILLHITLKSGPIKDIAVGCFHPMSKYVYMQNPIIDVDPESIPDNDNYRDIWVAVRKEETSILKQENNISFIEEILCSGQTVEQVGRLTPISENKRAVNNKNIRAIFGDEPPEQTVLISPSRLRKEVFEDTSISGAGVTSPSIKLLQKFLF
eukprot:CAMPEP_0178962692 /NCGR_PEP_ID=MMETSP0789-20121207/14519_1 /TAXON_ID=3005 /ORGANISM="Rhizosolenia setigera, Strain CCMP 1694" /LENGTH=561 /DNA_ID=CAMNT_0020646897 /DNA_START=186 /DNA_END=1871 /DNA_ORIENTATION=-